MSKNEVNVRLKADVARLNAGMRAAGRGVSRFTTGASKEFSRLKGMMSTVQGKLATIGVGVGLGKIAQDTAKFEKEMRLLQVSTGDSRHEMEGWRKDMLANQSATGTSVAKQQELSESLQAVGLGIKEIRTVLGPASETMAVASANADQLGKALGVAAEQFGGEVDLKNVESVRGALDKMLVAGRLGNAELEDLPNIFARIGGRAKEANLTFDQTLALTEALSQAEPQAERLATLTDSTLRVFTNARYMKEAQKATGIQFFDKEGSRRDPLVVLDEMQKRFSLLKTDAERLKFVDKAFGKTDLDTQRGLKKLMEDGSLQRIEGFRKILEMTKDQAKIDLVIATDNLPDQISRIKGSLREAVEDGFARPVNETLKNVIQFALDKEENGGLELTGKNMIAGGAGLAAASYALSRLGGPLIKKLLGGAGGLATGKALEATAGVTPVYVVNMSEGGGMGGMGTLGGASGGAISGTAANIGKSVVALAGRALALAIPLAIAGYAGYKAGSAIYDKMDSTENGRVFTDSLGEQLTKIMAFFGNKNAQDALETNAVAQAQSDNAVARNAGSLNPTKPIDPVALSTEAGSKIATQVDAVNKALVNNIKGTDIGGRIILDVISNNAETKMSVIPNNKNTKFSIGNTTGGPK